MKFEQLGLKPEILNAVIAQGYSEATPIQAKSIPEVMKGKDILAGAQTGTGKTAAFSLPILDILSNSNPTGKAPRALIITPTRELAAQIYDCIDRYSRHLQIKSCVVFGGVSINPQIDKLKRGVDILIATPGRLIDLLMKRVVTLTKINIFVLDEADRMLDMGFIHDIRKIIPMLPAKRQNLFFSATYTKEIKVLADKILTNPISIEVDPENSTVDKIKQVIHPVERDKKRDLLIHLIKDREWKQVLVFTRTKHGANRLAKQLSSRRINAAAIHGNKSQGARTEALSGFKLGKVNVLVATDIAARGIDISLLPYVVNYDLPEIAENYVHRIGRTGRAGAIGRAVSFVAPEDHKELRQIEKLIGTPITVENISGFDADLSKKPERAPKQLSFNRNREREKIQSSKEQDISKASKRKKEDKRFIIKNISDDSFEVDQNRKKSSNSDQKKSTKPRRVVKDENKPSEKIKKSGHRTSSQKNESYGKRSSSSSKRYSGPKSRRVSKGQKSSKR